jgi:hypothetical protein
MTMMVVVGGDDGWCDGMSVGGGWMDRRRGVGEEGRMEGKKTNGRRHRRTKRFQAQEVVVNPKRLLLKKQLTTQKERRKVD